MKKYSKIYPRFLLIFGISIIFIISISIIIIKNFYPFSSKKENLYSYYNSNKKDVIIVLNDKNIINIAKIKDNTIYVPISFAIRNLNNNIYYDIGTDSLLYYKNKQIKLKTQNCFADQKSFTYINNERYISLKYLKDNFKLKYIFKQNPNRILILNNKCKKIGTITKNTVIRSKNNLHYILSKINKNSKVYILDIYPNWTKVISSNGHIGLIKNRYIKINKNFKDTSNNNEKQKKLKLKCSTPIKLGFHHIFNNITNKDISLIKKYNKLLNVISPTCFVINNSNGNIISMITKDYTENAHKHKIKVLGLLKEISNNSSNMSTKNVLSNYNLRKNMINTLIQQAKENNLDGILLDIEDYIYDKNGDIHYSQFIKELSIRTHKNKLILCTCIYTPLSNNYQNYILNCISKNSDYVVMMGYDQFGSWSKYPGPNATPQFLKTGIKSLLNKNINNKRIILGIPFYNLLWNIQPNKKLSLKTIAIKTNIKNISEGNTLHHHFDKSTGYKIIKWKNSNNKYIYFVENKKSINKKLNLFKKYNLGGLAFWKLELENKYTLPEIIKLMNY